MVKQGFFLIALGVLFLFNSCQQDVTSTITSDSESLSPMLQGRLDKLLSYQVDSNAFPRSYHVSDHEIRQVPSSDWTSGFYPGSLWLIYQMTGDETYKNHAREWTQYIEKEKINNHTHDMGFKIYCSFGNAYELTNDVSYKRIILKSAQTLSTRFNENVGCIRSWDFNKDKWEFPVIIDNMMNLELLFEATRISGDSTYHNIAITHANTTLENHFRPDASSFHVVVFDTITGGVNEKVTHQGINNSSSWARGQAWGIYGFTMCYRYTKDPKYLSQAEASARFFLEKTKIRKDGIAFWDFDDPAIPNAPRDVSASTIVASALLELSEYTTEPAYQRYSEQVIASLLSEEYLLSDDHDAPFILNYSTGNWPKDDEIDGPISYADYYFLEALYRSNN